MIHSLIYARRQLQALVRRHSSEDHGHGDGLAHVGYWFSTLGGWRLANRPVFSLQPEWIGALERHRPRSQRIEALLSVCRAENARRRGHRLRSRPTFRPNPERIEESLLLEL